MDQSSSSLPSAHFKYDRSADQWDQCLSDPDQRKIALTWLKQDDTFDRWRHDRMYSLLLPFIEGAQEASWLTVGDGRYGTDANALLKMGAKNVHCSDISDTLLSMGAAEGFINQFSVQNAESLTFSDNNFDYVLCKEAYHHLPRPHIALHEMFRVARKAVILIEPRDNHIDKGNLNWILNLMKVMLRRGGNSDSYAFEPVGNFVFSLSERECEKILLGMNYRFVAFHGLNDVYEPGVEFIKLSTHNKTEKRRIAKLKAELLLLNFLTRVGLRKSGLMLSVLFKGEPDRGLLLNLKRYGWKVKELPRNPYA